MEPATWSGRTLRSTFRTDILPERDALADLLRPRVRNPVPTDTLRALQRALQRHLHDLVRERAGHLVGQERLRLPELDVLTEFEKPELWFPVPGMTGGFHCVLQGVELEVSSWVRVVEGSGETHRVRAGGYELVEEGYV
ncbi:MAG: hypothetical protein GEV28_35985 [Actinophytocola sp.]|uniref:hypothetical protein n=1 Tax=Actinophytocola sp. TaxID=1872138 RepID=UPI00132475AC|nr:hypothetical protein [Actinophytocola sp.]MPZ85494.1 hypothetical protein [Actinophytocola sp.]